MIEGCEPSEVTLEVLRATNKVWYLAKTTRLQTARIISDVLEISEVSHAFCPGPISWTRVVYYHLQKVQGPMAKNIATLKLPEAVMKSGENFVKFDNMSKERRIILLGSLNGLKYFSNGLQYFLTG